MVGEDVRLRDPQFEVEDSQELPLNPSDVARTEHVGNHRPVYVAQARVVRELKSV